MSSMFSWWWRIYGEQLREPAKPAPKPTSKKVQSVAEEAASSETVGIKPMKEG